MRLNVVRGGAAGASPIVFVHGLGSSSATWAACMQILGDRHEVIAVDLLGHGASPVPVEPEAYTRDLALSDLDDVLASLDGPAVLVGHSLGGYLSLAHAVTRPGVARAIVVVNTGPGFRDPDKRTAWNERSRRNAHKFGVPTQATELNIQNDSVVMDHLADVSVPTLVLAGELDRPEYVASGEYLQRKMPHARLQVIAGGEHSMHEDTHAVEVAAAIERFLADGR
jgi:pimeloyl-ACP methyl ester carboxylesterase